MTSITLTGVSKHYGAIQAVSCVDIEVRQGEFVTLLGPSGSGKTTVLSMIAGLNHPTSGSIWLGGRDVTWMKPAERNVGLVFQSYALFPHMTVFDNVAFPLAVRGVSRKEIRARVGRALTTVRLDGFGKRKPQQLSGGQQQRVALARAIVFEPDILLLDEPLGALDRKLREEVQVELRHLQRTLGITTVLVTHDQEEALSLSDRIVVLSEGRVQQIATPQEAYLRPRNRFVADFLGTANLFEARLEVGHALILDDGTRLRAPPSDLHAGAPVQAIVRPERIEIHHGELPGQGRGGVAASIEDMVYLGQSIRYHLRRPGGQPIIALSLDRGARHHPGQSVTLHWQPEDMWIIPAS
jgi:putative spermidine/putrescine transport system ATP-binding protein